MKTASVKKLIGAAIVGAACLAGPVSHAQTTPDSQRYEQRADDESNYGWFGLLGLLGLAGLMGRKRDNYDGTTTRTSVTR